MNEPVVKMVHQYHTLPVREEPFYDWWATAHDGIIELPASDILKIRAVFHRGYNTTVDGKRLISYPEIDEYVTQTAKSAEVDNESDDSGRQPTPEHRVRSSKRKSRSASAK